MAYNFLYDYVYCVCLILLLLQQYYAYNIVVHNIARERVSKYYTSCMIHEMHEIMSSIKYKYDERGVHHHTHTYYALYLEAQTLTYFTIVIMK